MAERTIEEIAEDVLRLDADATPGPWKLWGMAVMDCPSGSGDVKDARLIAHTHDPDRGPRTNNADLIAAYRTASPELAREVQRRIHLRTMNDRCAEALADEVAVLVRRGVIDSRSPAADALLDLRNPPSSPRADRLAELEREAERLRERDTARARVHELLQEQERRFDCHAGPGTTEPACGACTTCLDRELEGLRAESESFRKQLLGEREARTDREAEIELLHEERDRLRTSLDGAEVLCNALKARVAHG